MTHPGEQYYPQGVRWDDPIERGTLPDLSHGGVRLRRRGRRQFRDWPISYASSKTGSRPPASTFLRAGYGEEHFGRPVPRQYAGSSVNFFGALKAGSRIVHLSPLDGEIALSHKLSDSGARVLVTSNLSALLPTALQVFAHRACSIA